MTQAKFTPIDFENWKRKPYYEYYRNQLKTKYTISVKIDVTLLVQQCKQQQQRFFPTFLYVIMRAINQSDAFRYSIQDGKLGQWNYMQPAFTTFHEDDHSFSDLWSTYHEDYNTFYKAITADMHTYKDVKGIKIRPDAPQNLIPISCIPWIHFESVSQDSVHHSDFLHPIVRFGKYQEVQGQTLLPFSIYIDHATADGYHTATMIESIQHLCNTATTWLKAL